MTSVWGRKYPRRERPSVTLSAALSVTLHDFSPPSESGDELFDQPAGPLGTRSPLADALIAATNVPKYSKDDLQRILKAVLKARALSFALISAPALARIVAETPWEKLKACSPDVYCEKSYIDCYNFYQQCEDYFAIAGAMGPTQTLFATSFLWDRISFCWH